MHDGTYVVRRWLIAYWDDEIDYNSYEEIVGNMNIVAVGISLVNVYFLINGLVNYQVKIFKVWFKFIFMSGLAISPFVLQFIKLFSLNNV